MKAEQGSTQGWTADQRRAIRLLPNNLYFLDEAKWVRTRVLSIPIEGLGNSDEAFKWWPEHRANHAKETGAKYGVKLTDWPPTFSPEL